MIASKGGAVKQPRVTAFICGNCGRGGLEAAARFGRPQLPTFPWAEAVTEVVVPCTGRLQPEHLLRTFEAGADLVVVVACEEGNCHFLEGSCRAKRRCDYVGNLLDEIGLGHERVMLFHLAGSGREDMAAGAPEVKGIQVGLQGDLAAQVGAIATQVAGRLATLEPNGLREEGAQEEIEVSDVEGAEDNED